jgi:hypothetical protein
MVWIENMNTKQFKGQRQEREEDNVVHTSPEWNKTQKSCENNVEIING